MFKNLGLGCTKCIKTGMSVKVGQIDMAMNQAVVALRPQCMILPIFFQYGGTRRRRKVS